MFETVVVATDGSESVSRAVDCTFDLARRFDATVHALHVIDESRLEPLPERLHSDVRGALEVLLAFVHESDAILPRTHRPVAPEVEVQTLNLSG
jgi:nucleotide-binding universal stress UspA family protein